MPPLDSLSLAQTPSLVPHTKDRFQWYRLQLPESYDVFSLE